MTISTSIKRLLRRVYIQMGRPAENRINKLRGIKTNDVSKTGTEYFENIEAAKLRSLSSYNTSKTEQDLSTTASNINAQFFDAYGPEYKIKTSANVTVDPVWYYKDLLTRVKKTPNLRFETCIDGLSKPPTNNEIVCVIRHDVDGDLVAARQQARIENDLGIKSSFYLLHNAPYYGVLEQVGDPSNGNKTIFSRHESSIEAYLDIQKLDHELALHTDGMDYYQRLSTDGAQALKDEIMWLRNQGCDIRGTTAHNSFSVYGCNNYSIFKNRPLGMSTASGPKAVVHNGKWAPLQILDEKELKLEYEANDYFWQDRTPLLYGCLMTQNNWYIAENQYGLLSPETKSERGPLKARYGTHDDMIDAIHSLKGPAYVKLVVHPMHYGLRANHKQAPWLAKFAGSEKLGNATLWAGGGVDGEIKGSAITYKNEFSTPDRGLLCYKSGDFKIATLGGENVLTHTVSADSKFTQVTARMIRGPLSKFQAIGISAGEAHCDASKLESYLAKICDSSKPDVVILNTDFETNFPDNWSNLIESCCISHKLVILISNIDENNEQLSEFISKTNFVLIDPSRVFANYKGSAMLNWHNSKLWSNQGHHLIADQCAQTIISFFRAHH